jgi:hypothetical protein|tara:strand:+ start:1090 stop:1329 length:240 start_codon:yes stop_codon:yes gene_type:complete
MILLDRIWTTTNKKNMKKENFYVNSNDLWDIYDEIERDLGSEELALALAKGMGNDALEDLLRYIDRMYYANEIFHRYED